MICIIDMNEEMKPDIADNFKGWIIAFDVQDAKRQLSNLGEFKIAKLLNDLPEHIFLESGRYPLGDYKVMLITERVIQ